MTDPVRITPEEAAAQMSSGATYVDVRSEPEFAEGHPAGAYNVPFMHLGASGMTPNTDFVATMLARFAKDAKLVLGCKGGNRSLKAARELMPLGYTNLVDQRAGWGGERDAFGQVKLAGWSAAGLPTETGAPEGRSYASLKPR